MSFRKSPGEPPELTGRAEPSLCTWASFCSRPGTRGAWSQLRGPCYVWIVDKQGILVSISTFQILRVNSYSKKKKKCCLSEMPLEFVYLGTSHLR